MMPFRCVPMDNAAAARFRETGLDDGGNRLHRQIAVEDRYERASTLITSQLPVKSWHEVIGDATLADAICDRLVHCAHSIELKGPSLREALGLEAADLEQNLLLLVGVLVGLDDLPMTVPRALIRVQILEREP